MKAVGVLWFQSSQYWNYNRYVVYIGKNEG